MEISLDEVLNNMRDLKNKYEIKIVMFHKNRLKVGLQSIQPKDLNVKGGRRNNDSLATMLIKEEEYLNSLEGLKESYNLYREMAINILVKYAKTKSVAEMISIYRDKMKFKWDDIAWLVKYSRSQTIEIYNRNKKSDAIGRFNVI